ncbi:unnamed protein product [Closterium sp. NIES-53]
MTESQDVVGVATGIGAAVIARESLATGMGAVTPSLRESLPTGIGAGTPSLRAILPPGIGAAVIPRESLATGIDEILGRENPPNGPPLLRCYARRLPPCLAQRNAAGVGDGMKLEWVGEDEDAWEEEEGEGVCKGTIGKKRGCVGKARGLNELLSVSGEERRKGSKRAGEEDKVRDRGEGKVKEGIEKGKEMAREGKVEKEEGGKGKMKKDERGEGGHESLHACDECGKDFATWSKLNYHVATHTKPVCFPHSLSPSLPLSHSLTLSLTHSLTHSLSRSLTHSLAHSLAPSLTHPLLFALTSQPHASGVAGSTLFLIP